MHLSLGSDLPQVPERGITFRWDPQKNWPDPKSCGKNFGGVFFDVFPCSEYESDDRIKF